MGFLTDLINKFFSWIWSYFNGLNKWEIAYFIGSVLIIMAVITILIIWFYVTLKGTGGGGAH